MNKQSWSLLGHYEKSGRNSTFGYVYAVLVAMATFQSHSQRYKIEMSVIVLVAGAFIAKKALSKYSIVGVATGVYSLLWLWPIFDSTVFYKVDLNFVIAHAILAMGVGIGAFTFLKD